MVRRRWLGGPLINNRTGNKKSRLGRTDRRQNADKTYKAMTEWCNFKAGWSGPIQRISKVSSTRLSPSLFGSGRQPHPQTPSPSLKEEQEEEKVRRGREGGGRKERRKEEGRGGGGGRRGREEKVQKSLHLFRFHHHHHGFYQSSLPTKRSCSSFIKQSCHDA